MEHLIIPEDYFSPLSLYDTQVAIKTVKDFFQKMCIRDSRSTALRNVRERAKFRIQEGLVRGFRDFLYSQHFTEIHTPKIGSKGAEGGSNVFKLDYFHRPAVLAQSPQFYKQMMVGVFERVFELSLIHI